MWFFRRRHSKPFPRKHDIEAADVRPKGITRPLRQAMADVPPAIALGHDQVERAVQEFLSAENWAITHTILVRDQACLVSNSSIALLDEFARQARFSGLPGAEQVAGYLEAHRDLLERAMTLGVERAWTEFAAQRLLVAEAVMEADATVDVQLLAETLRRFLSTDTWDETLAFLIREQAVLLSGEAEQFLSTLIHVAYQSADPAMLDELHYMEIHRDLLRDARASGINDAWASFEATRRRMLDSGHADRLDRAGWSPFEAHLNDVWGAIRALLMTHSWAETRQVLERDQELLLSETCERILREMIMAAERKQDERYRVYLTLHQRLLRLARREGIPAAWASFEEAMGFVPTTSDGIMDKKEENPLSPIDEALQRIRDAVHAFLAAPSWEAAHVILCDRREDLLTDLAVALLIAQADQMQARGTERDLYATRLLNLQARLLRRAREIGLDPAWAEFEAERR
jgi:hypothetical protein